MTQEENARQLDAYERAIEEAIAVCGGDMLATIRALLIANEFLEHELERLAVQVSNGYARGRFRR